MKAVLNDNVIAESDDVITAAGYDYFPPAAVSTHLLEKAAKTSKDLECPHGVQFYDVVIDGVCHERAAWCYEAPRKSKQDIAWRYGFWKDVKVG